ncbi:MAG: Ig-like domain-containing protein [Anaerolineales bacterium]
MLASACNPVGTPTPTTSPSETPTPALVEKPTVTPLPTSVYKVVDEGKPLPPQVIAQAPSGGKGIARDGNVSVTFDQPMNQEKTASAWKMVGPQDQPVQGQVTWSDERTLQFKPAAPLAYGETYLASLGTGAVSAQGVALQSPFEFQVNTVSPLQVSQVFPADGTGDIENKAVITVIFNQPVVPLVIAEEQQNLPDPLVISPTVSGSGEWVNTSIFAFHPNQPLRGGTDYTAVVKAGLADAAGESQLAEDYTWHFRTVTPRIQSLTLSNGTENPPNGTQDVLLDSGFAINFFQPMNATSTEASLSLTSQGGEATSYTTLWNADDTRVAITPTERLAYGTQYVLKLDASAQAADGGNLDQGLNWSFTTVQPPGVEMVTPANGSTQDFFSGELRIKFASPMRFDTVKDKIVITPEPKQDVQWYYNDYDWSVSAYFLEPSTQYEVHLLPGMEDIYGTALQKEIVLRFTTAAYPPQANLQMPYSPSVFRAGAPESAQVFYAVYRNVRSVSFQLFQITADTFVHLQDGTLPQYNYTPSQDKLLWSANQQSDGSVNQLVLKSFRPTMKDGSALAPGFYFLGMDSPQVTHPNSAYVDSRLLVVSTANAAFKTTSSEALTWLTDLQSGNPVPGVKLSVYDQDFQPIGSVQTDANGLAYLDQLPAPSDPYKPRYVLANDEEKNVFAFASSQWGSGVSFSDYGLWSSYYAPGNQPRAYVYTERPIYRPGQPVYFKGIVRIDDDLKYRLPAQKQVVVSIDSYKENVYTQTLPLSDFGTFNGDFTLDQDAALGYYTINVRFPGDQNSIGSLNFSVAEYRKPEFQVGVVVTPTDVLAGSNFQAVVNADYFSGGAVVGAGVDWTLYSDPFTFTPSGEYSGYTFSDVDLDAGYSAQFNPQQPTRKIVAQGKGTTDANGELVLTLPADLSESKTSLQFTLEATVSDVAGTVVSGRATVTAHRSLIYPGVKPGSYVGTVGKEQSFDLVALDWNFQPLANQKLQVEISERKWYSVQKQDANGNVQWSTSVQDIPVQTFDNVVTDDKGEAQVSFTPDKGGVYRARVTAVDNSGNQASASAFMWVAGNEYIPWRQTNDRSFDLVTDRKEYQPGDTAEVLIASPFQGNAYALLTVERGHIKKQEVLQLTSNSTVYKLPITPDMAPNAFVSVLVVKGVDANNPRPNFKMGIAEIKVSTEEQAIQVQITPDQKQVSPGGQVRFTVKTLDYQGNPVKAEVSLGLSDLATLSLVDPNSPPIMDFFYSQRTLGVWTSMPIGLSIEDYNATIEESLAQGQGMGSGGGKGEGDLGVIAVRQNFPDTAFWDAQVVTGDNGQATVVATLPDNLTTWRMDARAVTANTMVGQAKVDIVSTKPLLVRPQTPRFFVVGDQASLGAGINNNTDQDLSVTVQLQGEGVTLQSQPSQQVQVAAHRQAYVSWDVTVNQTGSDGAPLSRVDLVFQVDGTSANGQKYTDASRPPQGTLDNQGIPVYRYEANETVGTSGQVDAGGSTVEAISLPQTMHASQGQLDVKVSPSLAAGMTDGLSYLEHYPYECVEQTVSRFLPNVITTRALKSAGLSNPDLEQNLQTQVNTGLQRLYNWQNADGGWGWWANQLNQQTSDPLTSAYVVLGLVEAKEAGYSVSEDVVQRGVGYLQNQIVAIANLAQQYQLNRQAFLLYVLARAGSPDVSDTVQLYDQRQAMDYYARAFLAQTFSQIDAGDPRVQTILSDLESAAITSATGTHWEEATRDPWNWNSDTRTTAIVLSVLSQLDTQNPLNANAVRWLMSNRTAGHWLGTQETAWTLMALTNWMVASGELNANYKFGVAVNGTQIGSGVADADTLRQTYEMHVDVANLLQDQINRLLIGRSDGPGNLYYTAFLNVSLPVDQVKSLDQGIIVSRSYYDPNDLNTPVSEATRGQLLLAKVTLVAPKALHNVVVDDPLPAGLEAVNQQLNTSQQALNPQDFRYDDLVNQGWGWWDFDRIQMYDQKVTLSATYLPAGTYVYTYFVRAGTAGSFQNIPATAQEFYFPEVYGRGDGSIFVVKP